MNEYVFFKLKPLCDAVLKQPTVENAKRLAAELQQSCRTPDLIPAPASDNILVSLLVAITDLNVR